MLKYWLAYDACDISDENTTPEASMRCRRAAIDGRPKAWQEHLTKSGRWTILNHSQPPVSHQSATSQPPPISEHCWHGCDSAVDNDQVCIPRRLATVKPCCSGLNL
ncbi:unnamed protein product [Polarella glacialis]|uniref:Uncharacterized protein n=1 Tax=Polarella glacialis TaxID=89957 RepID=A0A813GXN9_POLGL|nr:unnamed protein product [Polarella glacialis]